VPVAGFGAAYSAAVETWLRQLWADATSGKEEGLVLVAVGGLGRRMLLPASDLDLIIVHDGRREAARVAEAMWYPIWDSGAPLDHSVRSRREVAAAADGDLRVALGLLDARVVAGDGRLGGDVLDRVARLWGIRRQRWLPEVMAEVEERHRRAGDVAFLLEPDLKEGRGGLRDAHLLAALAQVTPALQPAGDDSALAQAADDLRAVMVALQAPGAASPTRLLLQDQDTVAARLGEPDADVLMARVAAAGREVAWAMDEGRRRVASWLAGPGRRGGGDRPLGPGVVLRDGEVHLAPGVEPGGDPGLPLRAAVAAVEARAPIARPALDRLEGETPEPPSPWSPETRHALVRLLGSGPPAVAAVEDLDRRGLMARLLPEWQMVRNRPQRNAYHRFTVDRHLLETAAETAPLLTRVTRPDLLIMGALLHDIGKGGAGDHSEAGAAIAASVARRMGFAAGDVEVLGRLVRHHLLLPDTAARRDLDDPATSATVAATVGDRLTLDLLAALAEADGRATGPAAWSPWKQSMVQRLVAATAAHLAGTPPPPVVMEPTAHQRSMMAAGRLALDYRDGRLTVVAPDQRGLLGVVAGVLALSGVDVRAAVTGPGQDGMALLTFEVAALYADLPPWPSVAAVIGAAMAGRLALAERLEGLDQAWRRRHRAAVTPAVDVRVERLPATSATVLEVRAPDSPGFLSRIATALASAGVAITSARVATYGPEVVDAFYVVDADGAALAPGHRTGEVVEAVKAAVPGPA
jgi:[protein-PII] uridylyltransferase